MIPIFKYGNLIETSRTSQSLFKDLKTIMFKRKLLPLRLDEFLKVHINSMLGSLNILARKQTVQYKKSSCNEETNSTRTSIDIIKNDENKV
jgi:hypothetical protein